MCYHITRIQGSEKKFPSWFLIYSGWFGKYQGLALEPTPRRPPTVSYQKAYWKQSVVDHLGHNDVLCFSEFNHISAASSFPLFLWRKRPISYHRLIVKYSWKKCRLDRYCFKKIWRLPWKIWMSFGTRDTRSLPGLPYKNCFMG